MCNNYVDINGNEVDEDGNTADDYLEKCYYCGGLFDEENMVGSDCCNACWDGDPQNEEDW